MVWREALVWVAAPDWRRDPNRPLPLVLYPPRSVTREAILVALEAADIPWRVACASGSLSGLIGAVAGGLGVGAQSACLKVQEVIALGPEAGLPPLGETEFAVVPAAGSVERRRRSVRRRPPRVRPRLPSGAPRRRSRVTGAVALRRRVSALFSNDFSQRRPRGQRPRLQWRRGSCVATLHDRADTCFRALLKVTRAAPM